MGKFVLEMGSCQSQRFLFRKKLGYVRFSRHAICT